MYICKYLFVAHAYMYIYTHTHTHIYKYIYCYMYMYKSRLSNILHYVTLNMVVFLFHENIELTQKYNLTEKHHIKIF